jgi:hypothetical protein
LSVPGGSFNSWSLITPTATFNNFTGTVFSNTNLALFQTLGLNVFSFLVLPSREGLVAPSKGAMKGIDVFSGGGVISR